jgi:hypothetical protein
MYENLSINQSKTEPAMRIIPSLFLFIASFLSVQQQIKLAGLRLC